MLTSSRPRLRPFMTGSTSLVAQWQIAVGRMLPGRLSLRPANGCCGHNAVEGGRQRRRR